MTITIIPPQAFKTIPWKNGLGKTTELAISKGGQLSDFDWRLSIATVTKDGVFSDFSGYDRNLILISGKGISLTHNENKIDKLKNLLDMSSFDGGCKTFGKLTDGLIKDFNVMTKTGVYQAVVERYVEYQSITLSVNCQYFVYALNEDVFVSFDETNMSLAAGYLLSVPLTNNSKILLKGRHIIVIQLISTD